MPAPQYDINTGNDQLIWHYARIAYDAYGQSTHWHAHNGSPMPPWEVLGQHVQRAWYDATRAIRNVILNQRGGLGW